MLHFNDVDIHELPSMAMTLSTGSTVPIKKNLDIKPGLNLFSKPG